MDKAKVKKNQCVKVGKLLIGGGNPVRVKGMLKTPLGEIKKLIKEAKGLEKEGAEALRVAVQKEEDTQLAVFLKKHISIPIAADIHFNSKLALLSLKNGFDQIRLNPLNITGKRNVRDIAKLARDKRIPIRVGINSGGFRKKQGSSFKAAQKMVEKTGDYIEILEKAGFSETIVSLKSPDTEITLLANRMFRDSFEYPLHLGLTATGSHLEGIVKSSVGLGCILSEGIGDIIRVSLTADSLTEIKVAKYILQSLKIREFGPEIISCPTCSRCEVDLTQIVGKVKKKIDDKVIKSPLKIAIMGCVVNGPGESAQADIGVAFGREKAALFKKGRIFKESSEKEIVGDLDKELDFYE